MVFFCFLFQRSFPNENPFFPSCCLTSYKRSFYGYLSASILIPNFHFPCNLPKALVLGS